MTTRKKITIKRIDPPKVKKKKFDRKEFMKLAKRVNKILKEEEEERRREGYGRFGVSF